MGMELFNVIADIPITDGSIAIKAALKFLSEIPPIYKGMIAVEPRSTVPDGKIIHPIPAGTPPPLVEMVPLTLTLNG